MFRFVGKLFGGLLRTILLGLLLVSALAGGGYYWYVQHRLGKTIDAAGVKEGHVVYYDLVKSRHAKVETGWPFALRAFVKQTGAHNWIPTEDEGLVHLVLQWSPDQNKWVEEPHAALPVTQRARLEALTRSPANGKLIEALADSDRNTREVAYRELRLRTDQDFGYRPDAPEAERAAAIGRWETWWDENKVNWTADKVIDKVQEILK